MLYCRILTLLKHKNTIICLQIFKKHAKLTYLFIWKTMLQSVILLWKCAFLPGMSVCYCLWNPPTASLTNCISAPRVASWWKTQRISFHSSSCALVPVVVLNLATCVCQVWGGGAGEKNGLQYFEFELSILHTAPLKYVISMISTLFLSILNFTYFLK